jgi:ectoine hydroxylase-related dioxygenase (phytanoyl-CoA dioxygenase family)
MRTYQAANPGKVREMHRRYRAANPEKVDRPRLIITPKYCAGWVRQLENMSLAVPAELVKKLPERARELIGYSIHPSFMGHVDRVHPKRLLQAQAM